MLSRDSKIATKLILDCKSKNQELLKSLKPKKVYVYMMYMCRMKNVNSVV